MYCYNTHKLAGFGEIAHEKEPIAPFGPGDRRIRCADSAMPAAVDAALCRGRQGAYHSRASSLRAVGTDTGVERYQFVRNGYFIRDCHDSGVFNNIVNLKDSWAKENK